MGLNTLLLISIGIISYLCFSNRDLFNKLSFRPHSVKNYREYYRFITSAWLHGDTMHLFINLIVLWSFGSFLIQQMVAWFGPAGNVIYLAFFVVVVIAAHIPTYLKEKNNAHYTSIGASGGVSGVLFATILINPLSNLYLYFAIPIPAILFGVLYIWYSIYMAKRGGDNVNHDAHMYGALAGMALLVILKPEVIPHFVAELQRALGGLIG